MAEEKVTFPMVGKVIEVHVAVGDAVEEDQPLATFESMKIEMPLAAPCSGTVKEILVKADDVIEADQAFGTIES